MDKETVMQMLLAASANGAYTMKAVLAACESVRTAGTGGHAGTSGQKPPAAAGAAGKGFAAGKKRKEGQRPPPLKSTNPKSPSSCLPLVGTVGTPSLPGDASVRDCCCEAYDYCLHSKHTLLCQLRAFPKLANLRRPGVHIQIVNPLLPLSPRRGSATSPDDHTRVSHYRSKRTCVAACYASGCPS